MMFAAALAGSALAFNTPVSMPRAGVRSVKANAVKMAVEDELGVLPPLGFWDPLDLNDAEKFERRRAVEIKHGRICMLAYVGYLVPEVYKLPGYLAPAGDPIFGGGSFEGGLAFADVPVGLKSLGAVPVLGWVQILFFIIAPLEIGIWPASDYSADYGTGYLGSSIEDPEVKAEKLNKELQNGRLAMLAIMGCLTTEGITHHTIGETTSNWLAGEFTEFGHPY